MWVGSLLTKLLKSLEAVRIVLKVNELWGGGCIRMKLGNLASHTARLLEHLFDSRFQGFGPEVLQ